MRLEGLLSVGTPESKRRDKVDCELREDSAPKPCCFHGDSCDVIMEDRRCRSGTATGHYCIAGKGRQKALLSLPTLRLHQTTTTSNPPRHLVERTRLDRNRIRGPRLSAITGDDLARGARRPLSLVVIRVGAIHDDDGVDVLVRRDDAAGR